MKTLLTPVDAPSIRSRPVYAPLEPRPASLHLIVADGEGAGAVVDLLTRANDRSEILAMAHVMYCPGPDGTDRTGVLEGLGAADVNVTAKVKGATVFVLSVDSFEKL